MFRKTGGVAFELCLLMLCGAAVALNTIDTFKPIARLSPARGKDTDEFGYSVAAHKMRNTTNLSFTEKLNYTVIIVGAPLGRYPGGLDLPLNSSVCELYDEGFGLPKRNMTVLSELTDEEIRECYLRTGLVYTCPLNGTDGCGPVMGNMDAQGADGALFDRVGNIRQKPKDNFQFKIRQNKDQQRMGNSLFSSGDFFVACAPFWQDDAPNGAGAPPTGVCVFSGQTLENFQYTKTCRPVSGATNNAFENACLSGQSVAIRKGAQLSDSVLGVTTPGRFTYTGGVYYYNDLNSLEPMSTDILDQQLGQTRKYTVRAAVDNPGDDPFTDPRNVPNTVESLYGYVATVGRFNGTKSPEHFYVSAPQFKNSEFIPTGRVYVVTNFSAIPNVATDGDEVGEYFGFSIAAPDLNGDGYDDMVVGAPMYSETSLPELGRIFILYNNAGQSFTRNQTVVGSVALGRFGHSVTSLGDLNNDGCDDIAVSAPFDKGGKVFIYYGSKETGINSTVQQTITAEQMTNQVTNLTSSGGITGFGFSLDGKVDVDDNQYRDLVVSAIGTSSTNGQAVFVLRSLPVATVSLNITNQSVTKIDPQVKSCTVNNISTTCFDFEVCGNFSGKGLSTIAPMYRLQENINGQQRIFFDPTDSQSSVITGTFNFSNVIEEFCMPFTAYVKNDLTSTQTLAPVSFTFSLLQFERSQSPVDTNFQPDNLEEFPVILSSPTVATISFVLDCGSDEVCVSDLELLHTNVTYRDNSGSVLVGQESLIVGNVGQMVVDLSYRNLGEPAFQTSLTFSLPDVFINPTITPRNLFITCESGASMNNLVNYTCTGFPDPLEMIPMSTKIQLTWQVSSTSLRGDEQFFNVPIQFRLNEVVGKNVENDTTLGNNIATVNVPVTARATVDVQIPQRTITYLGNFTNTQISPDFNNFTLSYTFNNRGPSKIFNASLMLLLPLRVPNQQDRYYLYPYNITILSPLSAINCTTEGLINPDNVQVPSASRRRRSAEGHARNKRQAAAPSESHTLLNCSSDPDQCQMLTCQLNNISSTSISITLTVIVDERTFRNMEGNFMLVTTARAVIHDNFIDTSGSSLNTSRPIQIIQTTVIPAQSLPVYVIILPIVGAILFLIVLAIILYCCGFFRRKSHKKDNESGVENFVENPFGSKPQQADQTDVSKVQNAPLPPSAPPSCPDEEKNCEEN